VQKILFASSEAYPLIKTGGLGDVSGALPRALQQQGMDVRLILPFYTSVRSQAGKTRIVASFFIYDDGITIHETRLPGSRVKVWLVENAAAFDRPGNPYLDENGHSWSDNASRFTLFCRAIVRLSTNQAGIDWQPDIVHCNDWQTGLVPALLQYETDAPASVFTIHNMAYQGNFSAGTFTQLGLPADLWHYEKLEFYDQVSFIKGGLVFADRINTVSPSYATEIQSAEFAYGMEGVLQARSEDLSGILNGIDTSIWNPGTDDLIPSHYNRHQLDNKVANKTALQQRVGLTVDPELPLAGMISRMVEQKGFDELLDAMETLASLPMQILILGNGEKKFERALTDWSKQYPEKIQVVIGYDEALSHLIEAGSDLYLMPSRFEPCGLNQMYSLRYGTLPVVRNVGGLADTVIHASAVNIEQGLANGFVVEEAGSEALISTIQYALELYQQPRSWKALQLTAMAEDHSWKRSASEYRQLYQQAEQDHTAAAAVG